MSTVHFVATVEPSLPFLNMGKLLVASLRQNGGSLKDAPVTFAVNGHDIPEQDARELEAFGNVRLRTMPRLAGTPHANKFNSFYAIDEPYDILVYLDCDTVVMGNLRWVEEEIDPRKTLFLAKPIHGGALDFVEKYDQLVRRFALTDGKTLDDVRDDRYRTGYPLFNSGVLIATQSAVRAVREEALNITSDLFRRWHQEYRCGNGLQSGFPAFVRQAWNRVWGRVIRPLRNGPGYAAWMTEQLGLGLAVIKSGVHIEPLIPTMNWTADESPPDAPLPHVYHYFAVAHDIDRSALFDGDWIREYEKSDSLPRRRLAELASSYEAPVGVRSAEREASSPSV